MERTTIVTRLLEYCVVAIMATMACMVFVNVVLRYGFNSGASITEEISRYLFVWLTFLGAILAFKDNSHVSVSVLVDKLSPPVKRLVGIATDSIMLFCCYLILTGSYRLSILNISNVAPISGIPTGVMYMAGMAASFGIGILLLIRIYTKLRSGEKS